MAAKGRGDLDIAGLPEKVGGRVGSLCTFLKGYIVLLPFPDPSSPPTSLILFFLPLFFLPSFPLPPYLSLSLPSSQDKRILATLSLRFSSEESQQREKAAALEERWRHWESRKAQLASQATQQAVEKKNSEDWKLRQQVKKIFLFISCMPSP